MHTDQHLASSVRDRRPGREDRASEDQLEKLVQAGLLAPRYGRQSKKAKNVEFETEVRDSGTRQLPALSRSFAQTIGGLVADDTPLCLRTPKHFKAATSADKSPELQHIPGLFPCDKP